MTREIALSNVDGLVERVGLDDWGSRMGRLASGEPPDLQLEHFAELERAASWLLSRVWPEQYHAVRDALENFRRVLNDLLTVLYVWGEDLGRMRQVRRIYQMDRWDEARHEKRLAEYHARAGLVRDLTLELTRAANLVCDRVRESLDPAFRTEEGAVVVAGWRPEYTAAEREGLPFPGLEEFEELRFQRQEFLGDPDGAREGLLDSVLRG